MTRGVRVEMRFSLSLPREALSIPMIRRVVGDALRGLGVAENCVGTRGPGSPSGRADGNSPVTPNRQASVVRPDVAAR